MEEDSGISTTTTSNVVGGQGSSNNNSSSRRNTIGNTNTVVTVVASSAKHPQQQSGSGADNTTITIENNNNRRNKKIVRKEISLLSVGSAVWVLMAVELAERTAYYGTAFTLTTFCIDILRINLQTTNIIVNLLYVVSPIAAVISGSLSDSYLQRRKVLAVGGSMYALGLALVAASGSPFMFHTFPYGPPEGHWGVIMVVIGVMVFGLGYGTMKVCISPLLADTALVGLGSCCRSGDGEGGSGRRIASNESVYVNGVITSARSGGGGGDMSDCGCGCVEGGYACRCNTPSAYLDEQRIFGVRSVPSIAVVLPHDENHDDYHHHHHHHSHKNSNTTSKNSSSRGLLDSGRRIKTHSNNNNTTNDDDDEIYKGIVNHHSDDATALVFGDPLTSDNGNKDDDEEDEEEEEEDEDTIRAEEARCLLSKLFRMDYWVINFGSLIGIGATPFLRQIGPDRQPSGDGGDTGSSSSLVIHTGYYIGYWVCAVITALAMVGFLLRMNTFASNHPGDAPSLFRALYLVIRNSFPIFGRLRRSSRQQNKKRSDPQPNANTTATAADVDGGSLYSSYSEPMMIYQQPTTYIHCNECTATEEDRRSVMIANTTTGIHNHRHSAKEAAAVVKKLRVTTLSSFQQPNAGSNDDQQNNNNAAINVMNNTCPTTTLLILRYVPRSIADYYDSHFNHHLHIRYSSLAAGGAGDVVNDSGEEVATEGHPPITTQSPQQPPQPPACPACNAIVHQAFLQFLQDERAVSMTKVTLRDDVTGDETISEEPGILASWEGPRVLQHSLLDWFVQTHLHHHQPHHNPHKSKPQPSDTKYTTPSTIIEKKQPKGDESTTSTDVVTTTPKADNNDNDDEDTDEVPLSVVLPPYAVVSPADARNIATTFAICSIFATLPVYWLLSIQFSTNVVMQASWMAMPDASVLPPEVFNNVNILTILISIPIFEKLFKRMYGAGNRPPVVGRIVAGFVLMLVAMSIIAALQGVIVSRGSFVVSMPSSPPPNTTPTTTTPPMSNTTTTIAPFSKHSGGDDFPEDHEETISYVLNVGEEYISAAWLVIPYTIQGLASVLVDTTCIEAAYTAAPENMKGSVMALYLLASSVSGLLGLIYAPFVTPQTMLEVMISLTALQGIVTLVFMTVTSSLSPRELVSAAWAKLVNCCCFCCCAATSRRHQPHVEDVYGGGSSSGLPQLRGGGNTHNNKIISSLGRGTTTTSARSVLSAGGAQYVTMPREHDDDTTATREGEESPLMTPIKQQFLA